ARLPVPRGVPGRPSAADDDRAARTPAPEHHAPARTARLRGPGPRPDGGARARPAPAAGLRAARRAQGGDRPRDRRDAHLHAADGRPDLFVRGARLPGERELPLPGRHPPPQRLHSAGGDRGDSHGVDGYVGLRQAGDRARLGPGRHPPGVAEAGRGVPRSAGGGRAGARRGAQLRPPRDHHGGHRHQEGDAAGGDRGYDPHLARRGGGAGGGQGVVRPRRLLPRRGRHPVHARGEQPQRLVRPVGRYGAGERAVPLPGRDRALRRRPVARPKRAGRGGADERRMELPARAPAAPPPLALRDHRGRRPAQRGAAHGRGVVLLPRGGVPAHPRAVGDRQRDRARCRDDDGDHARHRAGAGRRLAAPLQPPGGGGDVREHPPGGAPPVGRGGPGARPRGAARAWKREDAGAGHRAGEDRQRGAARAEPRRRVGRHRRHLVGGAHHHPSVPLQHPEPAGAQLVERHRHGHSHRAQGRHRRRQGHGHDDAGPLHAPRPGGQRLELLPRRADARREVPAADPPRRPATRADERAGDGALPPRDAALLLRSQALRHVPRAARNPVSHGARAGRGAGPARAL
ncbi:MAG: FIG00482511: hypothetical protein, partial [uncultured Gemmatimonadetes bacterium]